MPSVEEVDYSVRVWLHEWPGVRARNWATHHWSANAAEAYLFTVKGRKTQRSRHGPGGVFIESIRTDQTMPNASRGQLVRVIREILYRDLEGAVRIAHDALQGYD